MLSIKDYKKRFPLYKNIPDDVLADKLRTKFYPTMPKVTFDRKVLTPRRGLAADVGVALIGGSIDAIDLYARAARTLDQEGGIDLVRDATTGALDFTSDLQQAHPQIFAPSLATQDSYFRRSIYGGVRSFIPSVSAGVPGIIAGSLVGGVPGGILGFAVSGGTIFGLAEYDSFIEEAKAAGVDPEVAHSGAVKAAFLEGGLEGASDLISAAMLGLGKPLASPLKNTLKGMLKTSARSYLTKVAKISVVETTTEMAQAYGGTKLRQRAGIPTVEPLTAVKESIGPSLVMSFLFATGGTAIDANRKRNIQKVLLDPKAPVEKRRDAVALIAENLTPIDAGVAETWTNNALAAIEDKHPIPVDQDITIPQQILEKNIRKNMKKDVAKIPKEETKALLGHSTPEVILDALGDKDSMQVIEDSLGITDEAEQIEAIIADKVKQKVDESGASKGRGDSKLSEKMRGGGLENAKIIMNAGGDKVHDGVLAALGIAPAGTITLDPKMLSKAVHKVVALHKANEGATYNFIDGDLAGKPFYAVSPYKSREAIVKGKKITAKQLNAFIKANGDLLKQADHSIGTWYNKETDQTFLDVSITTPNREQAIKIAKDNEQLAIFNLATFEEIPTGLTTPGEGEAITTPAGAEVVPEKAPTFAEWHKDTHIEEVVYHGTGAAFTSFKQEEGKGLFVNLYGKGFYFTPSKEDANEYARIRGITGGAPNVIPAFLSLKAPFVVKRTVAVADEGFMPKAFMARFGEEAFDEVVGDSPKVRQAFSDNVSDWLKAHGFDGIIAVNAFEGKKETVEEIVVFEQKQIRSALAKDVAFGVTEETEKVGIVRELVRDERGTLFPAEPEEKFTTEGAQEVEKMYEDAEKAANKGYDYKKLVKILKHQIVDVRGNLQDALRPMGVLGQRTIIMQDLISGSHSKATHVFEEFKERIYNDLKPHERKYLDRYLTSVRILTIDKYKPIGHPRGLVSEHKEWLAQLSPELKTKLAERARRYFAATRWVLDNQLEYGLIDEKQHAALAEKGPFETRKFLHHVDPMTYSTSEGGKHISVGESGMKALGEGSEELLDTDSELLLGELIARHTSRTFRNEAAKSLYQMAQETDADFVKITSDKLKTPRGWKKIHAMIEGKRKTMIMKEELANEWIVRDAVVNATTAKLLRWFTGTSLLKAMATGLNPAFAITNIPRDIALVWAADYDGAYSKILPVYLTQMGHDIATVAGDAIGRKGRYLDALNDGGMMEFLTLQGRLSRGRVRGPAGAAFRKFEHHAGWLGETSEILVRLALRERNLRNGLTSQEATWAARNYLDFNKGGSLVKLVDNAVPYLNASVQAGRGMVRSAMIDPKNFAFKMAQVIGLSMAMFFANRYENPEALEDVNPHDRVNSWIFTSSHYFYDKNGNKKWLYYKVAKDQGQRVFASIGENMARALIGDPVHLDEVTTAAQDFLNLTGSGLLPPPIKFALGYWSNFDFWRDQKIWRGPEVEAKREFTRYTAPALKNIGAVTGLSPERLRYGLSQYFTSGNIWTSVASHTYNRITNQMSEKDRDLMMEEILRRKPGLRRIMSTTDPHFKFREGLEKAKLEITTERFTINQEFDTITQDVLRKDKPMQAVTEYLKTQPPLDRKRLLRRFKRSRKLFRIPDRRWWLDLAEMPAKARAIVYFQRWQNADAEERERLEKFKFRVPGVNSQEFRRSLFRAKRDLKYPERR